MKDIDVQEFIEFAATKHGRVLDTYEASVYLSAQELLESDSNNEHAATVVKECEEFLLTGEIKKESFARFLLPEPLTDEEITKSEKLRADYLEIYRKLGFFGILEGDYHAAQ